MLTLFLTATALAGADTTRLEVGSPLVNGRVYAPHKARVRVHIGELSSPPTAEWVNELTLGDSAGRPVMRWVTTGTRDPGGPNQQTWELRQTYDAVTLAPLGYASKSSAGGYSSLVINDKRVHGVKKAPADTAPTRVDYTIDRPGFIGSASDLVPLAVGLEKGRVMTAPIWSPPYMVYGEVRLPDGRMQRMTEVEVR
jgi:hypothetical protein